MNKLPFYLRLHQWVLVGYAVAGRGFAGIGIHPLYVGEFLLLLGLLRARIFSQLGKLLALPTVHFMLAFFFLCAFRLLFSLASDPIDALRDSAVWGYGLFALVIAAVILRDPDTVVGSVERYVAFCKFFVLLTVPIWVIGRYTPIMPVLPDSTLPIIWPKGGDLVVHITGVLAFIYLGFARASLATILASMAGLLIVASSGRAAIVAPAMGFFVLFMLRPRMAYVVAALGMFVVAVSLFSFVDLRAGGSGTTLAAGERNLNLAQIVDNFMSIFSDRGNINLAGTRDWRLQWWGDIFNYTFNGNHFWNGKGFGINLANADGYQVDVEGESLRSPHNSHLTFLARGGVPVFLIWILMQLAWAVAMLRLIFHARARMNMLAERLGIFLLVYWTAMTVNMNFDVYLEGPMGGIWFWTIFGYGLALQWLYRYRPEYLTAAPAAEPAPPDGAQIQPQT